MMEFQKLIEVRRSIRKYATDKKVTKEELMQDFWTLSTSFLKNIILFCRRMIMGQSTSWEMHRCL